MIKYVWFYLNKDIKVDLFKDFQYIIFPDTKFEFE